MLPHANVFLIDQRSRSRIGFKIWQFVRPVPWPISSWLWWPHLHLNWTFKNISTELYRTMRGWHKARCASGRAPSVLPMPSLAAWLFFPISLSVRSEVYCLPRLCTDFSSSCEIGTPLPQQRWFRIAENFPSDRLLDFPVLTLRLPMWGAHRGVWGAWLYIGTFAWW